MGTEISEFEGMLGYAPTLEELMEDVGVESAS